MDIKFLALQVFMNGILINLFIAHYLPIYHQSKAQLFIIISCTIIFLIA